MLDFCRGQNANWKENYYLIVNDTLEVQLRVVEWKESENIEKKFSLIMRSSGLWKNLWWKSQLLEFRQGTIKCNIGNTDGLAEQKLEELLGFLLFCNSLLLPVTSLSNSNIFATVSIVVKSKLTPRFK